MMTTLNRPTRLRKKKVENERQIEIKSKKTKWGSNADLIFTKRFSKFTRFSVIQFPVLISSNYICTTSAATIIVAFDCATTQADTH